MELKDAMIQYRAEKNLSQTDLAELCKVSLQTINMIENGKQTPSKLTKAKIRQVIGGDTDDS